MSLYTMVKKLANGEIPGVAEDLVQLKINEALGSIYDETDWSFQTKYSGWLTPGLVANVGTTTVTPYSDQVVGDATSKAIWDQQLFVRPFLTELQYRDPSYSLYNIVAYDTDSATLTLDRPWMEPTSGPGQPYYIYQAYFVVPVADFNKFIEIKDTLFFQPVSFTTFSQDDLARQDPRRVMFGPRVPTYAVPYGVDDRPDSSTPGYAMYELWPHILAKVPFSFSYKRRGPLLVKRDDTLPNPISEELVEWRTKEVLYQYKEAQKGENIQRGSGADWRFLAQAAAEEYKRVLRLIKRKDANLHRDFVTRASSQEESRGDGYSVPRTGQLNIGR